MYCLLSIGIHPVKYIETNAKDGTGYYQGFVTINKLSGDFHFKEEDLLFIAAYFLGRQF